MNRIARVILLTAALVGCADEHVLRTGTLKEPRVLSRFDPEIDVNGIKAGVEWTNVWVDLTVRARAAEMAFDPREFRLYVPATGMWIPASTRQIVVTATTWGAWAPTVPGQRDNEFRGGTLAPTSPTQLPRGTQFAATLMFETPREGAKAMQEVVLFWRDQRVTFRSGQ